MRKSLQQKTGKIVFERHVQT